MRDQIYNGGAFCRSARGTGNNAVTAGGAGDATQVDAAWIDRVAARKGTAGSLKVIIKYTATLAQGATLAFAAQMQDANSVAGAGAANFGAAVPSTVAATGPAGGGTVTGVVEYDVDLTTARQFFRARVTPDLSAANTDTAAWDVTYVLFGDQRNPSTNSVVNIGSAD